MADESRTTATPISNPVVPAEHYDARAELDALFLADGGR